VGVIDAGVEHRDLGARAGDTEVLQRRRADVGHRLGGESSFVVYDRPKLRHARQPRHIGQALRVDLHHHGVMRPRHARELGSAHRTDLRHHRILLGFQLRKIGALLIAGPADAGPLGVRADRGCQRWIGQANDDLHLPLGRADRRQRRRARRQSERRVIDWDLGLASCQRDGQYNAANDGGRADHYPGGANHDVLLLICEGNLNEATRALI